MCELNVNSIYMMYTEVLVYSTCRKSQVDELSCNKAIEKDQGTRKSKLFIYIYSYIEKQQTTGNCFPSFRSPFLENICSHLLQVQIKMMMVISCLSWRSIYLDIFITFFHMRLSSSLQFKDSPSVNMFLLYVPSSCSS